MGSTGKTKSTSSFISAQPISAKPVTEEEPVSEYQKSPSEDENNLEGYTTFTNIPKNTEKWFENPKLSNAVSWKNNLTPAQKSALDFYTGSGYTNLNNELYNKPWDEMTQKYKDKAAEMYNAINGFELHKGIKTVRQCDFQIFGAPAHKKMSVDEVVNYLTNETDKGLIQVNGFLSSTTKPSGTFADSHGVWIDIETPPNKGGGCYVSYLHNNPGEAEYLYNSNSVFQFDPKSVHMESDGYVHVAAKWVGQAQDQTFKKKKKA